MAPNILLIIDDQHNRRAMGWTGRSQAITPSLDRLARESVCFTDAYTPSPVCAPARQTLFTGLYASDHGALYNEMPIRPGIRTTMSHLNEAGYTTANIGKMHNTPCNDRRDFQFVLHHEYFLQGRISHYNAWLNWMCEKRGITRPPDIQPNDLFNLAFQSWLPEELTPERWITDQSVEFMRDHLRDRPNKPFFLHASYFPPHFPCAPIKRFAEMFDPKDMSLPPSFSRSAAESFHNVRKLLRRPLTDDEYRLFIARYHGFVAQLDAEIGRLLDGLKDLGIEKNTIVIFTSDHGDMLGEHGYLFKEVMWEGSVGIPLMVRWPGVRPRKESSLVSLIDLTPTILRAAGVEPDDKLPGKDLKPLIDGKRSGWKGRFIYSEFFTEVPFTHVMLREGDHKIVAHHNASGDTRFEFYDLAEDPWELRNLVSQGASKGRFAELRDELMAMWDYRSLQMPKKMPAMESWPAHDTRWPADPWKPVRPVA